LKEGLLELKKYLYELIKRKDLLIYLVISGIKAQHRNTYLGYLWWILDPLLMGIVYYLLRVVILGMKGDNIGAFLIIGLIAWKWIYSAITSSAKSISSKAGIITQVYLPKAIFPLGTTLTQSINFSFGLVVIAVFLAFYKIMPGIHLLWLPILMFVQSLFLAALSLILAYQATFVRDIENVLSHLMRFWFYSSPVIWETGRLPERYSYIVDANPASVFLIGYRNILMYDKPPDLEKLFILAVFSLATIIYMLYFYNNNEHKLIKAL
jgi:ABC-type polysaccharide/polyol phosphate export permease